MKKSEGSTGKRAEFDPPSRERGCSESVTGGGQGGLAGHELLRVLPSTHELVSLEEKHGAHGRLIEAAGIEPARNGRLDAGRISRRQVNLSDPPIGQRDVHLYEEKETSEPAALKEAGPRLHGPGDLAPNEALLLGQLPPPGRDSAEIAADSDLCRRVRIKGDESRIAVLAVAVALPNSVPAFARLRDVEDFHN